MNLTKQPDKIERSLIYADGGTVAVKVYLDEEIYELYVDKRIDTDTFLGVYTEYPDNNNAKMLNADLTLVQSIKNYIKSEFA